MAKDQAKTTQALKVSAYWSPSEETAAAMTNAVFDPGHPAHGVRVAGGRTLVKCALKIDFSDPANATRVAERVAEIKAALEASGKVHSFTTQSGAVPIAEALDIEKEEKADE